MIVHRITGRKFAHDLLGTGAAMFGGRWNPKGTPVLYTSINPETALLEVRLNITAGSIAPKLDQLEIEIPDDSIIELTKEQLPSNWKASPAPTVLAEIGKKWAESNESIALKVPCTVVETTSNFILNCQHPDFSKKVKIISRKEFRLDMRLFQ